MPALAAAAPPVASSSSELEAGLPTTSTSQPVRLRDAATGEPSAELAATERPSPEPVQLDEPFSWLGIIVAFNNSDNLMPEVCPVW